MQTKKWPTLYKQSSKAKTIEWTIETEDGKYRAIHGQTDGKKIIDEWTYCEPKNIGKANATTAIQQAEKEAEAKFQDKKKGQYRETVSESKVSAERFEVMLAEEFIEFEEDIEYPAVVQPKLDGIRCYSKGGKLTSREHNEFVSCPHISDFLTKHVPAPYILDGELYNHEYKSDFDSLVSLIKRENVSEKSLGQTAEKVQYWLYDYESSQPNYTDRDAWLQNTFPEATRPIFIKIIESVVVRNRGELDAAYQRFLAEGYEGCMVRWGKAGYENRRTKHLLKRKPHIDEEFDVVKVEEGKGKRKGTVGAIYCITQAGKEFKANVKGKREYIMHLWNIRDTLPGQRATIRYQNRTPDGIPRFGRMIAIRNYE